MEPSRIAFKTIAFLCLVCLPVRSIAGPDETSNALMRDSLSMLDWGVFRIQYLLDRHDDLRGTWISYDWESDEFMIQSFHGNFNGTNTVDWARTDCKIWFDQVRNAAGVNSSTGELFFGERSFFSERFAHSGFQRRSIGLEPDEILDGIDRKFSLKKTIIVETDDNGVTSSTTKVWQFWGEPGDATLKSGWLVIDNFEIEIEKVF